MRKGSVAATPTKAIQSTIRSTHGCHIKVNGRLWIKMHQPRLSQASFANTIDYCTSSLNFSILNQVATLFNHFATFSNIATLFNHFATLSNQTQIIIASLSNHFVLLALFTHSRKPTHNSIVQTNRNSSTSSCFAKVPVHPSSFSFLPRHLPPTREASYPPTPFQIHPS